MRILCTGNCGYIGSHVVNRLLKDISSTNIVGLDSLKVGVLSNSSISTKVEDIRNKEQLQSIFAEHKPDVVLHFAALTSVPESMENYEEYMDVNVNGTATLLEVMKEFNCTKIIFSSTASLYQTMERPCKETDPIQPLNNYALTKKYCEDLINHADWLSSIIFRYFNVVGFDKSYDMTAEMSKTNIVPALYRHLNYRQPFKVFGNKYWEVRRADVNDHTCVRDYIDVRDIAEAYVCALQRLQSIKGHELYNLGTKSGYSVLEVIKAFEKANNCKVDYTIEEPRKGDPVQVIADNTKARELLQWQPMYSLVESLTLV